MIIIIVIMIIIIIIIVIISIINVIIMLVNLRPAARESSAARLRGFDLGPRSGRSDPDHGASNLLKVMLRLKGKS